MHPAAHLSLSTVFHPAHGWAGDHIACHSKEEPGDRERTSDCQAGGLAVEGVAGGQLDGLPAPAGRLQQRVEVVGGVGPVREAPGAQDGVRQAAALQQLLPLALVLQHPCTPHGTWAHPGVKSMAGDCRCPMGRGAMRPGSGCCTEMRAHAPSCPNTCTTTSTEPSASSMPRARGRTLHRHGKLMHELRTLWCWPVSMPLWALKAQKQCQLIAADAYVTRHAPRGRLMAQGQMGKEACMLSQ